MRAFQEYPQRRRVKSACHVQKALRRSRNPRMSQKINTTYQCDDERVERKARQHLLRGETREPAWWFPRDYMQNPRRN